MYETNETGKFLWDRIDGKNTIDDLAKRLQEMIVDEVPYKIIYKDKNTGEVLIDETAAEIVREVFRRYIGGHGITAIARDLNNRGIKSPEYFSHRKISSTHTEMCKRFLWVQTSVKRILQNESYTGTLVNHKTVISKIYHTYSAIPEDERYRHEDFLPPIIDKQTWERSCLKHYHQNSRQRPHDHSVRHSQRVSDAGSEGCSFLRPRHARACNKAMLSL